MGIVKSPIDLSGQGWIYWGGCRGVPFFLIKKKKLQIIDSNLNNTANT